MDREEIAVSAILAMIISVIIAGIVAVASYEVMLFTEYSMYNKYTLPYGLQFELFLECGGLFLVVWPIAFVIVFIIILIVLVRTL